MFTCRGCGAQLNPTKPDCPYCKTRNSVDFSVISGSTSDRPCEDRVCPNCEIQLVTVDVGESGAFFIENCTTCGGLFFDNGELHALLDQKVASAVQINFSGLQALISQPIETSSVIRYRKCPVCREIMNREKFGERAGVVINHCHSHGIWLESGELSRLFDWKKNGGEILDVKRRLEDEQRKLKAERERLKYRATGSSAGENNSAGLFDISSNKATATSAIELFSDIAKWFFR